MSTIGKRHVGCKFPDCTNAYYSQIARPNYKNKKFFRFPSNPVSSQQWKSICKISTDTNCKNYFVCEDHFTASDFNSLMNPFSGRLNWRAIPKHRSIPNKESNLDVSDSLNHDHAYCVLSSSQATEKSVNNSGNLSFPEVKTQDFVLETELQPKSSTINENLVLLSSSQDIEKSVNNTGNLSFPEVKAQDFLLETELQPKSTTINENLVLLSSSQDIEKSVNNSGNLSFPEVTTQDFVLETLLYPKSSTINENLVSQLSDSNILTKIRNLYYAGEFHSIEEMLTNISHEFMDAQLRNEDSPSFTYENLTAQDKTFSLFLYHFSPRLYRYLKEFFQMPPICYLRGMMSVTPFNCGILEPVLNTLKIQAEKMNKYHRFCCLTFAETPLSRGFYYEISQKKIYGFEDLGYRRASVEANCALVFMVRGIYKNYNQVVAYYLVKDFISILELKEIIVDVIGQLQKIGLNVVATVCDHRATNKAALKALCFENTIDPTPYHFILNGQTVYTIFDVPNILKSTRNALMKNIIYYDQNKYAKFEYIEAVFKLDQAKRKYKYLDKLQQNDLNVEGSEIKKSVAVAAQQLSYSVASAIETFVVQGDLPTESMHTAEFVSIVDKLFDSLNGSKLEIDDGKPFTCALSLKSPHLKFWTDLLPKIKQWKMVDLESGQENTNCEFSHAWRTTINAIWLLWRTLKKEDRDYVPLRNLNLDKAEELFSKIKQRDAKPTCYQFVASLKTLVFNDLILVDKNPDCVFDYWNPLEQNPNLLQAHILNSTDFDKGNTRSLDDFKYDYDISSAGWYITNYVLSKMDIPDCQICRKALFSVETNSHQVIKLIETIYDQLFKFLDKYGHIVEIEETFRKEFATTLESFTFCATHNLQNLLLDKCFPLIVIKYVKEKNGQKAS